MKKIKLTDITLREASCKQETSLSFKEQIEIAKTLDRLKVDVIAAAPIINEKVDSLLTRTIASAIKKSALSVPVGYTAKSVDIAWKAVCNAANPRLYVEVPVSTVQMEFRCNKKPAEIIEMIDTLVRRSKSLCPDVEFAAQDATRSEPDFLARAIETAIEAGAGTVTLCDSVGSMLPHEFEEFIASLYAKVPPLMNVSLSVLCSDASSTAASCAITSVRAGASEINVSVDGNTAPTIRTIAHIIKTRGDDFEFKCAVKNTELHRSINQINWLTQAKRSKTTPFDTGVKSAPSKDIRLDSNDGISVVSKAVKQLGYDLSEEDSAKVFESFTNVAAKKSVGTKELEAIIASSALQVPPTYKLVSYIINSGNIISATANIYFEKDGKKLHGLAVGDGPIDASFLAIEHITGHHYELDDFQIQAVTEGREAMGSAFIKLRSGGKLYSGNGISTDIIGASIRAYINALNKITYEENQK